MYPAQPLLRVGSSCLVQIELIVQDDIETLLRKVVDYPHEAVECGVLRQICIAHSRHAAYQRRLCPGPPWMFHKVIHGGKDWSAITA